MTQIIHQHCLNNGMVLLAEEMPWLESAAFALLVPSGAATDPIDRLGVANLSCDLIQRGAGDLSNRQLVEALDRLGVDHSASVSLTHTSYSASTLAENLFPAIALHADLVRRPLLPQDQLEESRLVCYQEIRAAEDDLHHRVVERVRQLQYPAPWGRSVHGTVESVQAITIDDVRNHFQQTYTPDGAILSVAGKLDWASLRDHVEQLFGSWQKEPCPEISEQPSQTRPNEHIAYDSNQTHIAISYPSVPYRNDEYFQARAAVGVLSDGMSSRLFTEVREKEGLCYTIYASNHTLRDRGSVCCYSATSTDRAQETLDLTLRELTRLKEGVDENELSRLKARIKSALIMQQESSASRSVAMAIDWYHMQRIRSLDEVSRLINELTAESISAYVRQNPPRDFHVVSLGAQPLEVNI